MDEMSAPDRADFWEQTCAEQIKTIGFLRSQIVEQIDRLAAKDADLAALRQQVADLTAQLNQQKTALQQAVDALTRCQEASTAELLKHREERDALKAALKTLVDRLHVVHAHPAYRGVWEFCMLHGLQYEGPTYTIALAAAKAALKAGRP